MGSVTRRPDGTYRARWREYPGGPERARHFRLKRDADRHVALMESDVARGVYVDPSAGRVSLADVMANYIAAQPWRHNTMVNARNSLEHVRAHFADRPIGGLRQSDVQAFIAHLSAAGLEPRTVQTIYSYVRKSFRAAVDDGVIGRDPSNRVKLPRFDGAEIVVPTVNEVLALLDAAPVGFRAAIVLGAGAGLRAGEIAGLTVDRVDFLRREIRVDRQWHGKLDRFEPLKSKASNRTVPAGDRVLEELAAHVAAHGTGEHGVIVHADGRPLNSNRMDWRWERTVAGSSSTATLHDLRHHYASSLISAGCSIVAVQRALGHSAASITLDTYGHLMPNDSDRIRTAVDAAWQAAADQSRTERTALGL